MQSQQPVMRQEMRMKMNAQLIQSIQLLALPILELKQKIEEELEINPALEIRREKPSDSLDRINLQASKQDSDYYESNDDPTYGLPTPQRVRERESHITRSYDDNDNQRQFLEGALSRGETLQEHLLWQLRVQKITAEAMVTGEALIQNLDENGFLLEDPVLFIQEPVQQSLIPQLCQLIQGFDPLGTCTRDYKEALKVQMELREDFPLLAQKMVLNYFELMEKGRFEEIARKMKVSEELVRDLMEDIRTLTPFPGRAYSQSSPQYVIPDAQVRLSGGNLTLIINEEEIPILGVDPFFEKSLKNRSKERQEARQFIQQKVGDAERFMKSLAYRKSTLTRVCEFLVEYQGDFFRRGPKALRPLTLKDVALELEIHEATVSRITTGKYIQTEWGIYELKFFFSNAVGNSTDGTNYSKEGVKEIIREMLDANSGGKKFSDQKISDLLSQRGITIARRTVAKYRMEIGGGL